MAPNSNSRALLRALGLQLVISFFRRNSESPKIAIRRNRWTALVRCAIHVVPVAPSVALIFLNLNNSYIGGELAGPSGTDAFKLGALQFAAKLHELGIQASVAAMLLSYIRYELTFGPGLPFGAVHAGQSFTDLSYLWSSEFWGAMFSKEGRFTWLRKSCLVLAISGSVFLAAVAAPSSAISVIPQLGLWPACGTSFWINASSQTLWPSEVNSSHIDPICSTKSAQFNITCPSGGFSSIKGFSNFLVERGFEFVPGRTLPAFGTQVTRNMNVTVKLGRNPDSITTATVPQAALADGMAIAGTWWPTAARFAQRRRGLRYIFQRDAYLTTDTVQPITRVQCSQLKTRINGPSNSLSFPRFNAADPIETSSTDDQMWTDAFETNSTVRSNTNLYWVKLDNETAPNSTMGALVVLPISEQRNRLVYMTCNIDARWAESRIWRFHTANTMSVWGAPLNIPVFDIGRTKFNWTWRAISSTVGWAQSLNPVIDDQNTTVFASIATSAAVNSSPDPTHPQVVEAILAMMFSDGLARIGSTASLQGQLKDGGEPNGASDGKWVDEFMRYGDAYDVDKQASKDWINPRLTVSVYGWSYTSRDFTSQFALAVLLTHIFLVLCHLIYSLIWGLSSSSWDSPAEITALALNSKPSAVMQNTCAGISRLKTMEAHVRIVAMKGTDNEEDHLEMQFRSPGEGKDPLLSTQAVGNMVEANKVYGALRRRHSNATTPSEA